MLLLLDSLLQERQAKKKVVDMLSRFAVSGSSSVLRCTKCQVQGRALLTTKPNPNEAAGLKGILGRFFARRQMTLAMPISPAIGRTEPIAASRAVGWWLAGCAGMCVGAVILGGVTRLTESGLSMTDWTLLGKPPPTTAAEWEEEFDKYRQSPEFKWKNSQITLNEFKFIWYMEYGHRMWGRSIGAFFYIPAIAFWASGKLTPALKKRVLIAGGLLGFLLYSCYRFLGEWKVDTRTEEEGSYCWRSSWLSRAAWMVHGQEWVGPQQLPWPLRCAQSFSIPTCGSSLVSCGPLQLPLLERKVCAQTFNNMVSGDP